jgi:hypothetical protein
MQIYSLNRLLLGQKKNCNCCCRFEVCLPAESYAEMRSPSTRRRGDGGRRFQINQAQAKKQSQARDGEDSAGGPCTAEARGAELGLECRSRPRAGRRLPGRWPERRTWCRSRPGGTVAESRTWCRSQPRVGRWR